MKLEINSSWEQIIWEEFEKEYFKKIEFFLEKEKKDWEIIYPAEENILRAFDLTHFDTLKVVILGQDPYHGENQAHGLSFSVPEWVKIPPSLRNIYKELHWDIWMDIPSSWNLESWAEQWVLMLNSILTVRKSSPASHSKIGWSDFTDTVIQKISKEKEWVIFLLWWAFAQTKKELIDSSKHYILEAPHPSPFSAYKWFFGCGHFSRVNEILRERWEKEIDWQI